MGKTFGQKLIKSCEEFIQHVKQGKPIKQTFVRRMTVKGKTVYTHESIFAPLKKK